MDNQENITLHHVYEGFWKCRDFEISHLWQRSIFLAAFLVLVFSGYGKLFEIYNATPGGRLSSTHFHALAACLSYVGMVASNLWVCMAKASKKWYEKYEYAINDFMKKFSSERDTHDIFVSQYAGFQFEKLAGEELIAERYWERERNRPPWRTGGSNFSPSRINVFIGQFSWCVWFLLAAFHLVSTFLRRSNTVEDRLWCVAVAVTFFGTLIFCGFLTFSREHSPISSHE